MLKQRVITAVVLLALLLPALFAQVAWPFALLTLIAIGAAGWEWARLNGGATQTPLLLGGIVALACGVSLWLGWAHEAPRRLWWPAGRACRRRCAGSSVRSRCGRRGSRWPMPRRVA